MPEIAQELRRYGAAPYTVAVIHGGPGGAGEVAPVAQELGVRGYGVLEPLQSKRSIAGQIREVKDLIEKQGDPPVVLIGWSWGAWLSFILAAEHPSLVSKLIVVGSAPFKDEYAEQIMQTRSSRLMETEITQITMLLSGNADLENVSRIRRLLDKADAFDPVDHPEHPIDFDPKIYQSVWPQAAELRRSGNLLRIAGAIQCPVVAIHGDYDPHPFAGVETPLRRAVF